MSAFESYKLIADRHPFTNFYESDKPRFQAWSGNPPAYEMWESPWYRIEFKEDRRKDGSSYYQVECAGLNVPFDVESWYMSEDDDQPCSLGIAFHGGDPIYTPDELADAESELNDGLMRAVEACEFIEQRALELFGVHVGHEPLETAVQAEEPAAARSVSDLQLAHHKVGEYGEVAVYESDWLEVVFTRFGDDFLEVRCLRQNLQLAIEAHPQPIDGYYPPLLFLKPWLHFGDYRQAQQELGAIVADFPLVEDVCRFLQDKVEELFCDFIL